MGTIDTEEYDSEANEEVTSAKSLKGPKCCRILDSDDDDDCAANISKNSVEGEKEDNKFSNEKLVVHEPPSSDDELKSKFKKKTLLKKRLISDSESDADREEVNNYDCSNNRTDVWDMNDTNKINENTIDKADTSLKKKFLDSDIYDAEGSSDEGQSKISDHEMVERNDISKKKKKGKKDKAKKSFLDSDIYDAEGSSDESQSKISDHEMVESNDISKKKKKENKDKDKRNNLQRKSKQTAIEEIRSETQRLVRQSRISLPYHRPKQRSLSEFLDRRKSLPVVPLKTSTDELSKVWEKIEEREKTVESFYKSESDVSEGEGESSVSLVKISDDKINKSMTENENVIQESSLELCLHYTETESQEIQDKTSQNMQNLMKSDSEINEDTLNNYITGTSLKQIELTDPEETSHNELVIKTNSENILCDISSTSKINVDDVLTMSVEENVEFNLVKNKDSSVPFETSMKDDFSEPSCSTDDFKPSESEIANAHKILNKSNRLKPDLKLNKVPKLSGQPDEVIDLEKSPEKRGAVKLISRFMKHITLKPKIKVQENVVVAISEVNENGEIINIKEEKLEIKRKEESLKIKVGDSSKPGETRMKLKATLRNKIAQCREEQFAKRLEEFKVNEEEIFGEDEKNDYEEEAEELTASESESESEIEDDVIIKDKVKEKNPFVDGEAEESENDEEVIDNHDGSDAEEYSDAPSVDLASLVDKDEELPPLDADLEGVGSQRNDDLMALCSGGFASQPINLNDLEKNDLFTQFDTDAKDKDISFSPSKINEEPTSPNDIGKIGNETVANDEEESDEEITVKKKKKSKLTFSDDEDNDGDLDDNEDENPNDNESENSENEDVVNLESENEEIVLSGEDEEDAVEFVEDEEELEYTKVTKKAAKRFLEAEAELSGSEWGSADEDELELDIMEKEEGDEDVINQRKVRSELEKIHMKELLDEDKREIRALQELFLEDGELHSDGPKRQRQFRWYNQDGDNESGSFLTNLDGEFRDNGEEDEEDESWRKTRLERENFLRNQKNDDTEISDENVKFLKFAKKTVMKPSPKPPQSKFNSPDPRKQFSLVSRRGSFLSRGEKLLSKLAEITNVSSDNPLGNVRGQRNMVFATVSPPKEEPKEMPLKRKSTSNYPTGPTKKLKFSPPRSNRPGGSLFEKLKLVD
ncbi:claspin [Halyomorpha halys]|uniref:claspin n=1 Tax=Halyomorpha halys TaxID=286706 RepID=UPI0006D50B8C|nr:claspin [Halyomorpha halys]